MPLNTGKFTHDGFLLVIETLLPVVFLAVVRLADITLQKTGHIIHEDAIKRSLKRTGMRKSVEMIVHGTLTLIYVAIFFPFLAWLICSYILYYAVSYPYFLVVSLIFALSNMTRKHMLRFVLNEKWAKRADIALQIIGVIASVKVIF